MVDISPLTAKELAFRLVDRVITNLLPIQLILQWANMGTSQQVSQPAGLTTLFRPSPLRIANNKKNRLA